MSTLILYATKTGATKACAELLAEKIHGSIWDIEHSNPNIETYNTIILGTGVRMGKIYKPIKKYMIQNLHLLLSKRIAIFFCNAYPNTFQNAVQKNLPAELTEQAICIMSFGGKPPFAKAPIKDWLNDYNFNHFISCLEQQNINKPQLNMTVM